MPGNFHPLVAFPNNFPSGDHSIGVSVSASVLPVNVQSGFPLGLTDLIWLSKGLSRVFSNSTVRKRQFFRGMWPNGETEAQRMDNLTDGGGLRESVASCMTSEHTQHGGCWVRLFLH